MKIKKNYFPFVMKFTAAAAGAATILLVAAYRFYPQPWLFSAAISFGTTCYHFIMRLAVGAVVPPLIKNIPFEHPWFQPRKWENSLYNMLNVKKWKGNLPTYAPEQFDLRKITPEQVIRNTCSAEAVHEVIMVCSFIPLLFALSFGAFPVFLITSTAAALYDSIFVIAQRYNRPRLMRILKKRRLKAHE